MTEELAFKLKMNSDFDRALEEVIEALKKEGFGVLTQIDVRATLKEKLDVDFHPYVILGACNPPLAHRALSSVADIGVMLPCNVTVEQGDGEVIVSLANPAAMLTAGSFGESEELQAVAEEARSRIQNVAAGLSKSSV
ncbi:MAG: DUF302 domain-containing protein [Anaerolineales bacterium]|jgi:uncharacterized protein (DUF302 family)